MSISSSSSGIDEKAQQQKPESEASPLSNRPPLPGPPRELAEEVFAVKPTKEDLFYVLLLLSNLALTGHALQTNVKPVFGKTYGQLSFHAGALFAILVASFVLPDKTKVHRRTLEGTSLLQVFAGIGARPCSAIAATFFEENPTVAAWIAHAVMSFPAIGLGGAVWLHWTRKFMDQEPTKGGQLAINVFSCVALISVIKYLEPLIGDTVLRLVKFPPSATLIFLGMITFTLAVIFKPPRPSRPSRTTTLDNSPKGFPLSKFIFVMSTFTLALTIQVPPSVPATWAIQYQRFTPDGFIQVIDNEAVKPVTRYLRLDSGVLGEVELTNDGSVADTKSVSDALLDGVKLIQPTGRNNKEALVIGIQSGYPANSLISASYNTTIVDGRGPLVSAVQAHLGFAVHDRDSYQVVAQEPAVWVPYHAHARQQSHRGEGKFDVVIHDVFESGELLARIYTMELWEAVRNLLDENTGVLAVRYIGKPSAVTFKSVLNMLRKKFRICRAFHSYLLDQPPSSNPDELTEVVIFCTPGFNLSFASVSSSSDNFSPLTASVLASLDKREIDITSVLVDVSPDKYLLREEDTAVVRMWGKDSIVDYWKLSRKRYPVSLWYSY